MPGSPTDGLESLTNVARPPGSVRERAGRADSGGRAVELGHRTVSQSPPGRGRLLAQHHRPTPLTPALSLSGRRRPLVPVATVDSLGEASDRPLLPDGEKVPEGRMRGEVAPRSMGLYPARLGGVRRGDSKFVPVEIPDELFSIDADLRRIR
jgi:hypothetical protein